MKNSDNQYVAPSVTLSMMFSEAVYKAVIGVERFIRLVRK